MQNQLVLLNETEHNCIANVPLRPVMKLSKCRWKLLEFYFFFSSISFSSSFKSKLKTDTLRKKRTLSTSETSVFNQSKHSSKTFAHDYSIHTKLKPKPHERTLENLRVHERNSKEKSYLHENLIIFCHAMIISTRSLFNTFSQFSPRFPQIVSLALISNYNWNARENLFDYSQFFSSSFSDSLCLNNAFALLW